MKQMVLAATAILLATVTHPSNAQISANGFVRIPGISVGTDEWGRFVVCPKGTKAIRTDCESFRSKERVKGELAQDFLQRTQRPGAEFVGIMVDAAANGGAVIYYRATAPCLGPNGSNTRPNGTLWTCSSRLDGGVIAQ